MQLSAYNEVQIFQILRKRSIGMKKGIGIKTGKYFSQVQLLRLSGLTQTQLRTLVHNGLINEVKKEFRRYTLSELIYCRIVALLRLEFSMQSVRERLGPCKNYEEIFFSAKDFLLSMIESEQENSVAELKSAKIAKGEFVRIQSTFSINKDGGEARTKFIQVNLAEIISDLFEKSVAYNYDSVELKFCPLNFALSAIKQQLLI